LTGLDLKIVKGNLLNQKVEVIVNPWNRNIIPWWLLIPQGVSGQIKKHGGYKPFNQLAKFGAIQLGQAILTGAGKLPFKGIIHVAGINMLWRASEKSIRDSVINSLKIVNAIRFSSVAFPIIGAGSGSYKKEKAKEIMIKALEHIDTNAKIRIVEYNGERYDKMKRLATGSSPA
jgi:O-acetyl-ADP-ribose deacetylase (regulator of RNase III)